MTFCQENNKKLAYEQFLVEKKMIDDLVETIKAEDAQRREDEREQIRKHRQFIGNKEKDDKQREMELQQWQEDQENGFSFLARINQIRAIGTALNKIRIQKLTCQRTLVSIETSDDYPFAFSLNLDGLQTSFQRC